MWSDNYSNETLNLKQSIETFFSGILKYGYFYLALINLSLNRYTTIMLNLKQSANAFISK